MANPDSVVNASPLIFLAKADLLYLLQISSARLVVPAPVFREIAESKFPDDVATKVTATKFLTIIETPPVPSLIQHWDLGTGESSVLTYAHAHRGVEAILDDLAARRCANALGIACRGTLGLVLTAKQRGIVPAARPVLNKLLSHGMYLSQKVIDSALNRVGE